MNPFYNPDGKRFEELTGEEKVDLITSHINGKGIEYQSIGGGWYEDTFPSFMSHEVLRTKFDAKAQRLEELADLIKDADALVAKYENAIKHANNMSFVPFNDLGTDAKKKLLLMKHNNERVFGRTCAEQTFHVSRLPINGTYDYWKGTPLFIEAFDGLTEARENLAKLRTEQEELNK